MIDTLDEALLTLPAVARDWPLPLIGAIIVGVLAVLGLFRVFFRGRRDFLKCLGYVLTPDIISLFRGRYFEDWGGSLRFGLYLFICGAAAYATHEGIVRLLRP